MRLGIFGGTFNPIHYGHLRASEEIKEIFDLKKLFFIPSALPPHKSNKEIISASHRLKMIKLSLKNNPSTYASDIEIRRGGKSYSIDTIKYYSEKYKNVSLFFVIGVDAFSEINTWKEHRKLFSLCNFIVITRPGFEIPNLLDILPIELRNEFCYDKKRGCYLHSSNFAIFFIETTLLDISSTNIRKKITEGKSIKYMVPSHVEEYIKKNNLYKSNHKL